MPTLSTEVEPATGEVAVQRVKKENRQAEATATTTYMAEDVDWGTGGKTTTAGTTTVDREEASPAKAAKKTAPNQEQRLGWGRCNRGRRAEARKEQRQAPAQGGWSDRGRQARALKERGCCHGRCGRPFAVCKRTCGGRLTTRTTSSEREGEFFVLS